MVRRVEHDRCCGAIIDVQGFFLQQIDERRRSRLKRNLQSLVRLLGYFKIPIVVTLERPVEGKGTLPKAIAKQLGDGAEIFEKDLFDLTREESIRDHLAGLRRKQVIVAGCETDVCVLQSCLGLLDLGYEVYPVEDLLFSSSRDTAAAIARMRAGGAVFLSYKTLYYELVEAVDGGPHGAEMQARFGPFPDELPDAAV
jgi:nicotinamidase-related amidase